MGMEPPKPSSSSTSTAEPLLTRPQEVRSGPSKIFHSFRSDTSHDLVPVISLGLHGRIYNPHGAAANTTNTALARKLKGRHLQMIAIGGSIGSGTALSIGVQALGEMAVAFPVAGSFSAFATRFIDPAWGFAFGWNYAVAWLFALPLELMAGAIILEFWNLPIPGWAGILVFLMVIIFINLGNVKIYGEAEYFFSILKVIAVVGFIILGVIINCGGGQDSGYIGGRFWSNPGAFHNGFKGFCNILTTAAFSFAGTELVGLAAAEAHNPSKALPKSIRQVFWRISIFYVTSMAIVGLLVPYTSKQLIGKDDVDSKSSPFVIAIRDAGISGLDSVMNAVVLLAVLSVANSSMYGATRTLTALAEQGQAPSMFAYIDQKGRPLISIATASAIGLLAFIYLSPRRGQAFTWLLALSGLSSVFTWASICYAHIRFRSAWVHHGNSLDSLIYRSPIGVVGSWIGLISFILILTAQFWVAISPVGNTAINASERAANFFEAYLAMPVVLACWAFYKIYYRTQYVRIEDVDLTTGRNGNDFPYLWEGYKSEKETWPRWKVLYKMMC
ncbi:hypothetical protein B7494_g8531 [Chlorociboria aeruginascens]|nr:hypothetical protein B7494_g8531 [Chlorociboria aeruginascens]